MFSLRRLWSQLLEPQSLSIALATGCVVLAIALLVLMVSRWGQAKPLAKCAALSVFAHLLLFGYAYVFRVFEGPPLRPPIAPIQVRLSQTGHAPAPSPASNRSDTAAAWRHLPLEAPLESESTVPDRREITTPVEAPHEGIAHAEPAVEPESSVAADLVSGPIPVRVVPRDAPPDLLPEAPVRDHSAAASTDSPLASALSPSQEGPAAPIDQSAATLASDATPNDSVTRSIDRAGSSPPSRPERTASNSGINQRADNGPLPALYQNRFPATRQALLQQFGGSDQTEASVGLGLDFLVRVQSADGRWDASRWEAGREVMRDNRNRDQAGIQADTGMTGLALLALMGAGHTHLEGELRDPVSRGLQFLQSMQSDDGNLAGDEGFFGAMYCHGMALLALAEAYALTGDTQLKPAVERGIAFSLQAQHPESGGWRYQPWQQNALDRGDMSQFGWQVMALYSAQHAGIPIPEERWALMRRFVKSCAQGAHGGLSIYRPEQLGKVTPTMTGEALWMRFLLQDHHALQRKEAADYLLRYRPGQSPADFYLWYYGTMAMFQVQGSGWEQWNQALQAELPRRQITTGELAGSWDPDSIWGPHGGRVYSTALGILSLEVYYRYLPLLQTQTAARR